MIIIGVDPGISGAISIVENKKILEVYDTPTMIEGKKNKRQINGAQVTNIIKERLNKGNEVVVVVEHVNAMPGQGVTSMFNFGQSFGVIKGICAALSLPIYFVRPTKWKKHFNLIKTHKDASRTKVIEAYPEISSKLHRKKDCNRADAILIALYFNEVATQVVGLGGSTDFSLIQLFLRADFIVKSVIILLIAASIYSWALIFDKYKLFKKIEKTTTTFEEKFWKSKSAESFYNSLTNRDKDPVANIFQSAMAEVIKTKSKSSVVQSARVSRIIEISTDKQIRNIEKNFTFLATVGSTAPFIGLFGTVWGIMNSFQSIAISRNTSLAIVAPGIAEALFATALGLLAAIPAVVAYNKFNSDAKRYGSRIENFSKRFLSII